jgi:putative phosphoribosyl transferase
MFPDLDLTFADRADAGRRLAPLLAAWAGSGAVVLGLPRGGVPVAAEVAEALSAPLDVIVVRKLGVPVQPELAMGALGEDGVRVLNREVLRSAAVTTADLAAVETGERVELARRTAGLRRRWPRVDVTGRPVIIVDDGIATGATARAACAVGRAHGATHVVLAAPVAPPGAAARFAAVADDVVVLSTPRRFTAVGEAYVDFGATTDDEVAACLDRAATRRPPPP